MRYLKYITIVIFTATWANAAQVVTIEQLQGHSSSSPYAGSTITTYGVVTGVYVNTGVKGFTLEEKYPESGPWHGVFVYTGTNPTVSVGDSVEVTGLVEEYYGLTELHGDTVNILASGVALPDPYITTADSLNSESFEGVFVKLEHAVCETLPNNYGEWYVNDGTGSLMVDDLGWTPTGIQVGQKYNITGTIYYAFGNYRLEPRSAQDVEPDTANTPPFVNLISFSPKLPESDQMVEVKYKVIDRDEQDIIISDTLLVSLDSFNTIDKVISIHAGSDTLNHIENDSFYIYHIPRYPEGTIVYFKLKVRDTHNAESESKTSKYLVNPGDKIIPIAYLHMLDEMGHSLFLSKSVKIQGIVTVAGDFGKKYYMQDNTGGVVLYNPATPIMQGDSVVITGYVSEYNGVVELNNATALYQDPGHVFYPKVVTCKMLSEDGEKYEGMFVEINHVTTTSTDFASGSTITISDQSGSSFTLYVDPSSDLVGKPIPRGEMTVRGVISQYDPDSSDGYFSGYQIVPRGIRDINASGNGSGKLSILPPYLHKGRQTNVTFLLTKDLSTLNAARIFLDTWADTSSINVDGASYTLDEYYHLTLYNFTKDTVKVSMNITPSDSESLIQITVKTSETDTLSLQEMLQSPYKLYVTTPIEEVQKPGNDGVTPQDTGKTFTIGGIVIGPNSKFSGSMTNLWIQDDSSGIEVFYYSPIQSFDTGDVVIVKGTITEYNGLTEITPESVDDIVYVGHITVPEPINLPESQGIWESIEGDLISFQGVLDNNPYVQGSGYNMIVWNGTAPITVYVYKTTGIDVSSFKKGDMVKITGIAGQYDYQAPYTDGYQVLPRFQSDIQKISAQTAEKVKLSISPNVVDKVNDGYCTIYVEGPQEGNYSLKIYNESGKFIKDVYGARRMGPQNAEWKLDDASGNIVPIGYYIVKVDVLMPDGKHETAYKPVVITRPK